MTYSASYHYSYWAYLLQALCGGGLRERLSIGEGKMSREKMEKFIRAMLAPFDQKREGDIWFESQVSQAMNAIDTYTREKEFASYCNGIADNCEKVTSLFGNKLPEDCKKWLQIEKGQRLEETKR